MYQLFIEGLQRLGRALMLPIAILPIAGLLLRLGDTDLLNIAVMHDAGQAIFAKLALRGLVFLAFCWWLFRVSPAPGRAVLAVAGIQEECAAGSTVPAR